ncbi:hypothetical protein Paride_0184 [Pseudomonas phage Paride]|nr:hypothetical protein Paride_0184 [Pseudomonas phage Paride]
MRRYFIAYFSLIFILAISGIIYALTYGFIFAGKENSPGYSNSRDNLIKNMNELLEQQKALNLEIKELNKEINSTKTEISTKLQNVDT